jgi:predicted O-methyltransferase YrrM
VEDQADDRPAADEVERLKPQYILELGVAEGGSTALLAELCRPTKLVSLDIRELHVEPLARYIERKGLTQVVRGIYRVDHRRIEIDDAGVHVRSGAAPIDRDSFDLATSYRAGGVPIGTDGIA